MGVTRFSPAELEQFGISQYALVRICSRCRRNHCSYHGALLGSAAVP
jgi:hypothetical protein